MASEEEVVAQVSGSPQVTSTDASTSTRPVQMCGLFMLPLETKQDIVFMLLGSESPTKERRKRALSLRLVCLELNSLILRKLPSRLRDELFQCFRNLDFDFSPMTIRQLQAISYNDCLREMAEEITVSLPFHSGEWYSILKDKVRRPQDLSYRVESAFGKQVSQKVLQNEFEATHIEACTCWLVDVCDHFTRFVSSPAGKQALVDIFKAFPSVRSVRLQNYRPDVPYDFPQTVLLDAANEPILDKSGLMFVNANLDHVDVVAHLLQEVLGSKITEVIIGSESNGTAFPGRMAFRLASSLQTITSLRLHMPADGYTDIHHGSLEKSFPFEEPEEEGAMWTTTFRACSSVTRLDLTITGGAGRNSLPQNQETAITHRLLQAITLPRLAELRLGIFLDRNLKRKTIENLVTRHGSTLKEFDFVYCSAECPADECKAEAWDDLEGDELGWAWKHGGSKFEGNETWQTMVRRIRGVPHQRIPRGTDVLLRRVED